MTTHTPGQFTQYRRKQIAELQPWVSGYDMQGVSVSAEDAKAGSPKTGDMIARNPKNHADRWLVAAAYFAENFEAAAVNVDEVVPYEVLGTSFDGVTILAPKTKSSNFTQKQLQAAFAALNAEATP